MEPNIFNTDKTPSRRDEIVAAARELYETRGLEETTIKDISDKLGVARSLFYHYFKNKDAVTDAVIDDYVNDFLQMVYYWNEDRTQGDVLGALESCIQMLRRGIFDKDQFRNDLATNENARLYLMFLQRSAEGLAKYVTETTVADYERLHDIRINHVYETFYVLIIGMIGFMRRYPDAPDELLKDLIAQTLRLDMDEDYIRQKEEADSGLKP
jgi:AcrR family transcriptional regulator